MASNTLLDALNEVDRAVLGRIAREEELPAGHVLYEPGDQVRFSWFPCGGATAAFSLTVESGQAVEIAMIGREGAVGGIVSQGRIGAYARAEVIAGGTFVRVSCADLEAAKEQSPHIRHLFARYADCLLAQVFQSVACNATHPVEQRAAKWLCAAVARTGTERLTMTQEQLGMMVGAGRSYTSRLLQRMKAQGLIATRRGAIEVRDPAALHAHACACNDHVNAHFATVLRDLYPVD